MEPPGGLDFLGVNGDFMSWNHPQGPYQVHMFSMMVRRFYYDWTNDGRGRLDPRVERVLSTLTEAAACDLNQMLVYFVLQERKPTYGHDWHFYFGIRPDSREALRYALSALQNYGWNNSFLRPTTKEEYGAIWNQKLRWAIGSGIDRHFFRGDTLDILE